MSGHALPKDRGNWEPACNSRGRNSAGFSFLTLVILSGVEGSLAILVNRFLWCLAPSTRHLSPSTIPTMKAIVATAFNGCDSLEVKNVPEPIPQKNEVVVNIEAVGVNFADALGAMGKYPGGPQPPYTVGREFAGHRADTNELVMGYAQFGACAEKISVNTRMIWPVPAGWSAAQGAAFPVTYFTAWLLYWKSGLIPGGDDSTPLPSANRRKRVLIHAAAGGVGTSCVQLGRLFGVEMFGTASQDEKITKLKAMGLEHPINYSTEDYEQRIEQITRGEGVDAVFDSLAGEHTAKSLRCCGFLGRVILFGNASGDRPKFDTMAMYNKSLSAHGLWLSRLAEHHDLIHRALEQMKPWIASGELKPVIGAKFPLESAADGFRLLLSRNNFGKVVLTV
jgi:NADPH:quinone reductase